MNKTMVGRSGRSGRPKQTAADRKAKQASAKKRVPSVAGLPVPTTLGPVGRRYWDEAVNWLAEGEQLTKHDAHALEAYAMAWEKWWELEEHIRNSGSIIYGPKGTIFPNPACHLQARQMERIGHYQGKFGFTPHARMRVKPLQKTETKPPTAAAKLLALRFRGEPERGAS